MFHQSGIQQRGCGLMIHVRPAIGLGHNVINAAQFGQVRGGDTQRLSGQVFFGRIAHMMAAHPSGEITE